MINRYSSRTHKLHHSFLNERLLNALAYDRVAGYFSSSLLELAGEAIESIEGKIRIVCNSDLDERDVVTAKAAEIAIRKEWCSSEPEKYGDLSRPRFRKLYELLVSGKLEVRVLPTPVFGLLHGKAGVITLKDGSKTAFMGSTNETYAAWRMNYEMVWEDNSPDAITWVQEEFNFLWYHKDAQKLSDAVISDIGRIASRTEVSFITWKQHPEPASAVIESPVYRKEYGLWAHQKYFVKKAFEAHIKHGARFVLADMVGLGKTIQLALAAQLMALYGNKPVLVLAPKTLIWQWQEEIKTLLDLPSAVWNGRQWVDENGVEYTANGAKNLKNCPRKLGIVSQGIITSGGEGAEILKALEFECVIVDEAHRARRRKFDENAASLPPEPNNLMRFIYAIAPKTRSLLLATATPVQIHPIEAYDFLDMLATGNEQVFGNTWSRWRNAKRVLEIILKRENIPADSNEFWEWLRNPLPPASEDRFFEKLRLQLDMPDSKFIFSGEPSSKLSRSQQQQMNDTEEMKKFFGHHNPFLRHIIRRTRSFLENTRDPETKEPYLKPVRVKLFGEEEREAITLPGYLKDAYQTAEEFTEVLSTRMKSAGFLKTLLLRRLGSTIEAGRITVEKMLKSWSTVETEEDDIDEESSENGAAPSQRSLTGEEQTLLQRFLSQLNANKENDPKYEALKEYLLIKGWLTMGCIVFSQYYDSVKWLAYQLTKDLPEEPIAIYAGGTKSGIIQNGNFRPVLKEEIKARVKSGDIRLVLGTDAASEGLNLQRLGTLINLDLPWNPTKLEQRKGRIQRIGQVRDEVLIYNMRYRDSVEDRVHDLLSARLENIRDLFGQIPDVLEDAWVELAIGNIEKAKQIIDKVPQKHPFELRYDRIEPVNWETCSEVLNNIERRQELLKGW